MQKVTYVTLVSHTLGSLVVSYGYVYVIQHNQRQVLLFIEDIHQFSIFSTFSGSFEVAVVLALFSVFMVVFVVGCMYLQLGVTQFAPNLHIIEGLVSE